MKQRIKKLMLISAMLGILAAAFAGCSASAQQPSTQSSTPSASNTQTSDTQTSQETSSQAETQEALLYIGREGNFKKYSLEYQGERKPETFIQGISSLTGWDLSLSDAVTTGKGGMTVSFAKTSALFVGPPENQKDEFFMYDAESLIPTILDSVKKTLQENFVDTNAGGDPDSLNIYYCMEGDQPLTFDNMDVTIPMDTPYTTFPKE